MASADVLRGSFSVPGAFNQCVQQLFGPADFRRVARELGGAVSDSDFDVEVAKVVEKAVFAPPNVVGADAVATLLGELASLRKFSDPEAATACFEALKELLKELLDYTECGNWHSRLRALKCIHAITNHLFEDRELEDDLATMLVQGMLPRLNDKNAKVRTLAVHALKRFPCIGKQGQMAVDPVVKGYVQLLEIEDTLAVRQAVIEVVPIIESTMDLLMEHTLDASHEVCCAVYKRMESLPLTTDLLVERLRIEQRPLLILRGLTHRHASVVIAGKSLIKKWYNDELSVAAADPGQAVLALLKKLNVEENYAESELLMDALMSENIFDSLAFMNAQSKNGGSRGLRSLSSVVHNGVCDIPAQLTSAEEAFLWRVVFEKVNDVANQKGAAAAMTTGAAAEVEAAMATKGYDALDGFVPESAEHIAALITAHVKSGHSYRFAACQLMQLAGKCMDWTDASSMSAASEMLTWLMLLDPRDEAAPPTGGTDSCLTGCGGEGAWELSVSTMMLAVHSSGGLFVDDMMANIKAMLSKWQLLPAELAAMSSSPTAPPCLWLQCLTYVALMLQHMLAMRNSRVLSGGSARDLNNLYTNVMPLIRHGHVNVRILAYRCLGLLSVVPELRHQLGATASVLQTELESDGHNGGKNINAADGGVPNHLLHVIVTGGLTDLMLVYGCQVVSDAIAAHCNPNRTGGGTPSDVESLEKQLREVELGNKETTGVADESAPGGIDTEHFVDAAEASASRQSPIKLLLFRLSSCLQQSDSDDAEDLATAIVEGFTKLLFHQEVLVRLSKQVGHKMHMDDAEVEAVLSQLSLAYVHPLTEEWSGMRQCLAVFFEVFATQNATNKRHLAASFMQAVKSAVCLGSSSSKKAAAPTLIQYTSQLLQLQLPSKASGDRARDGAAASGAGGRYRGSGTGSAAAGGESGAADAVDDYGHGSLSHTILKEILGAASRQRVKTKDYVKEFSLLLQHLAVQCFSQRDIKLALNLVEHCERSINDQDLLKGLLVFKQQLTELEESSAEPLSAEELVTLHQKLASHHSDNLPSDSQTQEPVARKKKSKSGPPIKIQVGERRQPRRSAAAKAECATKVQIASASSDSSDDFMD